MVVVNLLPLALPRNTLASGLQSPNQELACDLHTNPAMAEHAQASQTPLMFLFLCILLLSSPQRATSMILDDDVDFADDDMDFADDVDFSGRPARRLYDESFNVLNSNSSNISGGAVFCGLFSLQILDLSNNQLTGELPDCWWDLQSLQFMDLSNNSFSGEIPAAETGYNCSLESVHLARNGFTGVFPSVLEGCNSLVTLDIEANKFSGGIPPWIGSRVRSLRILSLRSNNFSGAIPSELSQLSQLQLLDMAHNSLTGLIPRAFGNLTSMTHPKIVSNPASLDGSTYQDRIGIIWKGQEDRIGIIWKGRELIFQRTIQLMTGIDLSGNSLSQCIPEELTNLQGLRFLNLSRNHLSCPIPENIGSLKFLESLDLSSNQLLGAIPPSMSNLLSLGILNLSNNHLSGKIPTGNQLQTLTDPSIYSNNSGLCGSPLTIPCENTSLASDERNGSDSDNQWLYYCVIAGIVFGFWLWFGMLFSFGTWRSAVFFFVDGMQCKIVQKVSYIDQFLSKGSTDQYL